VLRARPFVSDPGRELFPRFTPEGRWVIYTRAGAEGEAAHIRLRAVDGTEDRILIQSDVDNLCGAVSPDGMHLAWLRLRPGGCEVVQRPLLGGPSRVLAGCDATTLGSCPEWTPDGRGLVLGGGGDGDAGLREIALPQGTERLLTHPDTGQHDLMPRASPDGRRIVFWRGDHWGRTLFQLDRATLQVAPLRAHPYLAFGHAFAASGDLLLADDSLGQRALVRLSAAGTGARLLGALDARFPDIAANGAIVYEVARYDANLWRMDPARGDESALRLTQSARYDSQPALSPDGEWLAFGSNRDGREGVYVMRSDGRGERNQAQVDPGQHTNQHQIRNRPRNQPVNLKEPIPGNRRTNRNRDRRPADEPKRVGCRVFGE
jgi:Tol biopolymer transport system component